MWIEELRSLRREKLIGREIHYFPEIDSTNLRAHEEAGRGAAEGTAVLADFQSHGRGRLARGWHSPAGLNLYASVILRPPIPPASAPQITLIAGVAVARALASVSGLEPGIKWPNDIYLNGRKVAGILSEMDTRGEIIRFVILGVGVNVNSRREDFPPELSEIATSLRAEAGREIPRESVASKIFEELEEEYLLFLREGLSPRLNQEWNRLSWINGKRVTLRMQNEEISGQALGLDTDGALLLLDEQGRTRRYIAGDVSLRL
jgi:BirA family biotin operon repressor/biotin-[acetyl-CoA-carboxylase] ligase